MAAPITLLLQSVKPRKARRIYRTLSWQGTQVLTHPITGLILNIGGMYLLYLTPLYALSTDVGWVSALVHWHFLIAGCVFVWAIAGPDRVPHRPGYHCRLFILFIAVGAHATLTKVIYAYGLPYYDQHARADIEAGAQGMYYGGGMTELVLIIAFFAMWFGKQQRR